MRKILNYSELKEFCYSHGGIKPNAYGNDRDGWKFTSFYCSDKRHDSSRRIECSKGQGEQDGSMVGILCMHGYVVEFDDDGPYLFCTDEELRQMLAEQNFTDDDETLKSCRYDEGAHLSCPHYEERYKFTANSIITPSGIGAFVCHESCDNDNCPFISYYNLKDWNEITRKRSSKIL